MGVFNETVERAYRNGGADERAHMAAWLRGMVNNPYAMHIYRQLADAIERLDHLAKGEGK
jgi:hypothetical protein